MNELKGWLRLEVDIGFGIIFFGLGNVIFIWEWWDKDSEFWIVMFVVIILLMFYVIL